MSSITRRLLILLAIRHKYRTLRGYPPCGITQPFGGEGEVFHHRLMPLAFQLTTVTPPTMTVGKSDATKSGRVVIVQFRTILQVLASCYYAQLATTIIERIAVNMVNVHARGGVHDKPMQLHGAAMLTTCHVITLRSRLPRGIPMQVADSRQVGSINNGDLFRVQGKIRYISDDPYIVRRDALRRRDTRVVPPLEPVRITADATDQRGLTAPAGAQHDELLEGRGIMGTHRNLLSGVVPRAVYQTVPRLQFAHYNTENTEFASDITGGGK